LEFIPGRESTYSGWLYFQDGLIYIIAPILLLVITKDTNLLIWIGFVLNVIGLLMIATSYFPESTKFLISTGNIE